MFSKRSNAAVRFAAFITSALAIASAIFWGVYLAAPSEKLNPVVGSPPVVFQPDSASVARLLGAPAPKRGLDTASSLSSRFVLLGVLAEKSGQGVALLAVDGKPSKPFRVGSEVVTGYRLESVRTRSATLQGTADSAPLVAIEMAPLKK